MRFAGQAILWQLWRRHRWGLAADMAYLAIAPALISLIAAESIKQPLANVLGLLGIGVLTHLMGVFSYGFEADLAKKESGYPLRAFILPVTTRALTCWPMISGAITLVAVWAVIAVGVWRPCGYATPIGWPGLALAALLGMSQAIGWAPFSMHWFRFLIAMLGVCALAVLGALVIGFCGPDNAVPLGLFAGVWSCCLLVAQAGLARARRSEPILSRWNDWLTSRAVSPKRKTAAKFRSPLRAQLWFEMRRHGWFMPLCMVCLLPCVIPILLISPAWRVLIIVSTLPPLVSGIAAMGFGKADPYQRGLQLPQFIATRPISCGRYVAAKMFAAAIIVLISCTVLFTLLAPFFCRSDNRQSLSVICQGPPDWKVGIIAVVTILGWMGLSWRQLAGGMWISLSGRPWVGNVNAFTFALVLLSSIPAGFWLFYHPEHREGVLAAVPWIMGLLLAAKIAAAAVCSRQLVQRRILPGPVIGWSLVLWCSTAVTACGLAAWLLPTGTSTWQLAVAAALLLPFTRLIAAPLALWFNRHR